MPQLYDIAGGLQGTNWGQTAGQNIRQNQLLAQEQQKMNALGALLPQAMSGDQSALARAYQIDPGTGLKINALMQEQANTDYTRKTALADKTQAQFQDDLAGSLAAIAQIPDPAQRQEAYGLHVQKLSAQYPTQMQGVSPTYDDSGAKRLAFALAAKDKKYADLFERVGFLPQEPEKPTDLMRNLADPTTSAFLREQEANKVRMREMGLNDDGYHPLAMTNQGALQWTGSGWAPVRVGGAVALPVSADVGLAGDKAAATARGREIGEAQGGAVVGLGNTLATTDRVLSTLDQLRDAPGRKLITGGSSIIGGPLSHVPGTEAADARVLLEQAQGQTFLTAFETLKGGGQITNVEGEKATNAIGRLKTAQSDEAFEKALSELRQITSDVRERAIKKAEGGGAGAAAPAAAASGPREGATAVNPQTGQRITFRGGQWVSQ